ncbi:hypothetical protein TNIN_190301 [Trichonephila inaurata madagascariensis]|uniref:Uncharacterized protein n=1 Tax=Trichonephila inaurata madagascariensis TaxID=2747483 RepID=A0A8X7CHW5_9ARAC|nr:hypothetical protein TNIN_190301 [Trichonephila inaurata madagascariensis]
MSTTHKQHSINNTSITSRLWGPRSNFWNEKEREAFANNRLPQSLFQMKIITTSIPPSPPMLKRQEGLPIPQTIFFEDWFTPGLFVMQGGARTLTCTRQVHVRNGPCPTPKGMDSIGYLFTAMWQVSCNYRVLFNDRYSPRIMRFDPKSFELF